MDFLPPDPQKRRELEAVVSKSIVTPVMYGLILDITEGHHRLRPCPCEAVKAIAPPPLVSVTVPVDFNDPPPVFKSFVESKSNRAALEICRGWTRAFLRGKDYAAPILCGPVGTGKTRLLWTILGEIAAGLRESNEALYRLEMKNAQEQVDVDPRPPYRRFSYSYVTLPRFSEMVRVRSNLHSDVVDYRSSLCLTDILVLDDIGAENATDLVREQVYLLIDERVARRRPLLAACNFSREEIGTWLGDRIRSRIEGACDIVEVYGTDMRAKEKERRLRSK